MTWLPEGFAHPERVDLATGHHLRPIREADVEIDYPAVMGSRERLWAKYGEAWRWPPATMSYEEDKDDLARHEAESPLARRSPTPSSTSGKRSCSAAFTLTRPARAPHLAATRSRPGGWSTRLSALSSSWHSTTS
jgi:hypothetical protein